MSGLYTTRSILSPFTYLKYEIQLFLCGWKQSSLVMIDTRGIPLVASLPRFVLIIVIFDHREILCTGDCNLITFLFVLYSYLEPFNFE